MSKMSIFDHLDDLTLNKSTFDINNDEQAKSYDNFRINRFVSMVDIYLPIVNEINKFNIPKDVHHNYYKRILPKRKCYFNYITPKKEIDDKTKKLLCEYYRCASGELEYHLRILTPEQIKTITDLYKYRNSI
jgi:hypothetical protein